MKPISKLLSGSLILSICSSGAFAQSDIETIVVSGSRIPISKQLLSGSVDIIDTALIETSRALNLADLLRGSAGITLSQSGGPGALTEIRMRGTESNHVLVLLDGIEVNDAGQGGLANLAHISLDNVERIEILKGAQSALWGSGAVGGVINIISKKGSAVPATSLNLEAGNDQSYKLGLSTRGIQGNLGYSASLSHADTDGQNISRTGDEKDGYKATQLNSNLQWDIASQSEIRFSLRYLDARNEFDDFVPSDSDQYTELEQIQSQLVWRYGHANDFWNQDLGVQYTSHQSENFNAGQFDSLTDSNKLRLFWQNTFNYHADGSLSISAEHSNEEYEQKSPFSNQQQDIDINSIVFDLLHEITPHFNVTASLRYDDNSEFDSADSYRVGVNYRPSEKVKLFASYGKAVKNPTFTEIFGFIPASFTGNPDLDPEQSNTFEVGAQIEIGKEWDLELAFYDAKLKDEITTIFFPDFTSTVDNAVGESERQGVEISAQGFIGPVKLNISYGYNDSTQPDFSGVLVREARRARNTASLALLYPFNNDKSDIYVSVNYQGNQQDTDFSTFSQVTLGGYTIVDLTFNHEINSNWQLFARANNLFDKKYEDIFGFSGQEQRISAGVEYRF